METYIIRVNGFEYEVEVEKKAAGAASQAAQASSAAAAPSAQAAGLSPAPKAAAAGKPVATGTAGKVWKVVQKAGAQVKRGDSIVILEAMKMEIPVVAPEDGTIGEILVTEGEAVESGQAVATIL
ncbi:MAG: acetyl-CoA carboxylase biotin carboxyl carrier protein subunit [Anaerovoracaceae bacterium]